MEQPTIKYPIVISRLTNMFCTCNHCGKLIPPKAGFTVCAICHQVFCADCIQNGQLDQHQCQET